MKKKIFILISHIFFLNSYGFYESKFSEFKYSKDKYSYFYKVKKNDAWSIVTRSCENFLEESHLLCQWRKQFLVLEKVIRVNLKQNAYVSNFKFYQDVYTENRNSQIFSSLSEEVNKTLFLWHGVSSFVLRNKRNFIRSNVSNDKITEWLVDITHLMSFINTFDIFTFSTQNYLWFKKYNNLDKQILVPVVDLYSKSLGMVSGDDDDDSRSFIEREFNSRNFLGADRRLSRVYNSSLLSKLFQVRSGIGFYTIRIDEFNTDLRHMYSIIYSEAEKKCKSNIQFEKKVQFKWAAKENRMFCDKIVDTEKVFLSKLRRINCSDDSGVPYLNLVSLTSNLPESKSGLLEYCSVAKNDFFTLNRVVEQTFKLKSNFGSEIDEFKDRNIRGKVKKIFSHYGRNLLIKVRGPVLSSLSENELFDFFSEDFL